MLLHQFEQILDYEGDHALSTIQIRISAKTWIWYNFVVVPTHHTQP